MAKGTMVSIVETFPNLTILDLGHTSNIDDDLIPTLSNLPSLVAVNLLDSQAIPLCIEQFIERTHAPLRVVVVPSQGMVKLRPLLLSRDISSRFIDWEKVARPVMEV